MNKASIFNQSTRIFCQNFFIFDVIKLFSPVRCFQNKSIIIINTIKHKFQLNLSRKYFKNFKVKYITQNNKHERDLCDFWSLYTKS